MAARLVGFLSFVRLATLALLHPGMSGPAVGSCWFRWESDEIEEKVCIV